jgi:hypothetical protein
MRQGWLDQGSLGWKVGRTRNTGAAWCGPSSYNAHTHNTHHAHFHLGACTTQQLHYSQGILILPGLELGYSNASSIVKKCSPRQRLADIYLYRVGQRSIPSTINPVRPLIHHPNSLVPLLIGKTRPPPDIESLKTAQRNQITSPSSFPPTPDFTVPFTPLESSTALEPPFTRRVPYNRYLENSVHTRPTYRKASCQLPSPPVSIHRQPCLSHGVIHGRTNHCKLALQIGSR